MVRQYSICMIFFREFSSCHSISIYFRKLQEQHLTTNLRIGLLNIKKYIFTTLAIVICFALDAQPVKKFSGQNYTVNEGLLVNKVVDIAEDNNGFIWISTGAGLQSFDGSKLETIIPQPGLPETNHPLFFKLKDGSIWLSYYHGISAYNSVTNKFKVVYKNQEKTLKQLSEHSEISPLRPVIEEGSVVWCWSAFNEQFVAINKFTFKVTDSFRLSGISVIEQNFRTSPNGILLFNSNKGLAEVDFKTKKLLHLYPVPGINNTIYNFTSYKNNILSLTKKGIHKTDVASRITKLLSHYPLGINPGNVSLDYLYDNLFVAGINSELFVINADTGEFLYRMVNQQNEPFVTPGYINFCMMDRFNHLWVVSMVEGLKKINFNKLQIKYYGVTDLQKNFSRCIYPDKKANLIITGSLFNGISVFDTTGQLLMQYNIPPYAATAEVNCILKIALYKYLIFLDSKYSVYLLDAKKWKLSPVSQNNARRYYPLKFLGDTAALLWHSEGLTKVSYLNNAIRFEPLLTNKFSLCGLLDKNDQLWLGAAGRFSILKGKSFEDETVYYLKQNIVTKCFFQDKIGFVWLGTEGGLYKLNPHTGAIVHIYKKADGLADETIYSVMADDNNNIWCSTNKGISCIYTDGKIINIYASDGLQHNEFNTNSSAKSEDGELFFGGINGVNSFYPDKIKDIKKEPNVLITNIKVLDADWNADTAAWHIHRMELSYTQNIVSFDFTALGWYNPEVYNYQYRMIGIDKGWVNAGNRGYTRYALPPGEYTFEYTALNNFDKNPKHVKYISIIITPPFWQTGWFIILMAAGALFILISAVRFYSNKKYRKKLREIEIQKTLQKERERISRDLHDNIGAYATVLMANTEQLKSRFP